ncbi:hypothetical protein ACJRO7_004054 [Eucalyptus globulus]|uniref:ADP-ribosyl cyclase/cyclic ADP-ribose hydrolase n=1 Tax=Eucalyptus globulus TaxID=34317 RepID=A0ABD3IYY5_EUCGL
MAGALALCVSRAGPVACGSTHYDVFLSFPGGSDTTLESFPGRLHACLAAVGVSICRPDESQAAGSSSSLLPDAAIWRSKICIPILSEDYVCSDRCLHELVQVMEGKRSARQMVLPIFNRVEPSHLRYPKGSFEKACHSDIEGVQRALFEVSMLHGWKITDGSEDEVLKIVVPTVLRCFQPDLQNVFQSARYNVFLNFRGADTRHGIAYNLYKGLMEAGVSVFKDDTNLSIGEEFGSQLLSAITRCTIYITILSPTYASSKWCLHELAKMSECSNSRGHVIMPLFYGVVPSDVRHLRGRFGDAFRSREQRLLMGATGEGLRALKDVCELKGCEVKSNNGRYDGHMVGKIVDVVLWHMCNKFRLDVPKHLLRSNADK